MPNHCNCEAVRSAWIAQPSAFWSSGAYFIAWFGIRARYRQKNITISLWLFVFFLLALASHFAHGSMTEVAMAFDFAGICLMLLTPMLLRLTSQVRSPALLFTLFGAAFGLLSVSFFGASKGVKIGLALMAFAFSLIEQVHHHSDRTREPRFRRALLILAGSFLLFLWDESKIACDPFSLIQGHTLWHFGSAWAIYEYSLWFHDKPKAL
jgi:hypothetical protein